MTEILLVEDDPLAASAAKRILEGGGYTVHVADSGRSAVQIARETKVRLIMLDLGLPDLDGTHLLSQLQTLTASPVIVVTARDDTETKISMLDLGADDYVIKPFVGEELLARIRTVLRRADPRTTSRRESLGGGFEFDPEARMVFGGEDRQIALTAIEAMLLGILVASRSRPLSRQAIHPVLFKRAWERGDRTLDVHVHNLRQKLLGVSDGALSIASVRGIGYALRIREGD